MLTRGAVPGLCRVVVLTASSLAFTVSIGCGADPSQGVLPDGDPLYDASAGGFDDPVIRVIPSSFDFVGTSLALRRPPISTEPVVGGVEAVSLAEGEFGASVRPETVVANLAWDEGDDRLVWAVSVSPICVPELGPSGAPHDPCGTNEIVVIIDATTGEVDGMLSFREV